MSEAETHQAGYQAGEVFVNRHVIEKINTFLETYRRKGLAEEFIQGFMDGISDNCGIKFSSPESTESSLQEEEDVVECAE